MDTNPTDPPPIRGRGAAENPRSRFETLEYLPADEARTVDDPGPDTRFYLDTSRTVIAHNESPDVGFDYSVNPYRGCEHGCIYCYARPTHEYLGFSAGLDFESRILVKRDAPDLLRSELMRPGWTPRVIALSGVTDPYQPIERRLRLTRACLEVLAEFRNPVMIVTKNHLVTRDADLLGALAEHDAALVNVSVTTLRNELQRVMEPRTAIPARRLDAIRRLARAGLPVRVLVGPVIPGLTEHELPAIIERAAEAGARSAGYIVLRLPHGVGDLFERWLERHFPDRKAKVMNRIRALRGGRRNETRFHARMRGEGIFAEQIRGLFHTACTRAGIEPGTGPNLSTAAFRRPGEGRQLGLFDGTAAADGTLEP
ncbi:MAG: PA0069 family radical SAM protein [Gemmatimonadota bacterium]